MGSGERWREQLNSHGVQTRMGERFGESIIQFEDPHGLSLGLIETQTVHSDLKQNSQSKSAANRIVGFHSATALLRSLENTQSLLVNLMGMMLHDTEGNRYRFKMKHESMRSEIERRLPKLHRTEFTYEFVKPDDQEDARRLA